MRNIVLLLLFTLLPVYSGVLQQVDPVRFTKLDTDPLLLTFIGQDRVSKLLILNKENGNTDQIGFSLLDAVIVDKIRSGDFQKRASDDIMRGDYKLKNALLRVLMSLNYSETEGIKDLSDWSKSGGKGQVNDLIRSFVTNPAALAILRDYFLEVNRDWVDVVSSVNFTLKNKPPIPEQLLVMAMSQTVGQTRENLTALWDKSKGGDIQAQWALSEIIEKLITSGGAIGQVILSQKKNEPSSYIDVWDEISKRIAESPLTLTEFVERSARIKVLYDTFREIYAKALESDDAEKWMKNYIAASVIPGTRYEWVVKILTKGKHTTINNGIDGSEISYELRKSIIAKVRKEDVWADYMLWHLTRPAEAVCLNTRIGLPAALAGNQGLAIKMARSSGMFGIRFQGRFTDLGGYKNIPGGKNGFQKMLMDGKMTDPILLQWAGNMGNLLLYDDELWAYAVDSSNAADDEYFADLVYAAIDSDPSVAATWLKTINKNDPMIKKEFGMYAVNNGIVRDERQWFVWLNGLEMAVDQGNIVGNSDLATFKQKFREFLSTPAGINVIKNRLKIESTKIPFLLREIMVNQAIANPRTFWEMYSLTTGVQTIEVVSLVPRMKAFVASSRIPEYLLSEIAARNIASADAIDSVWDKLLAADSPVYKGYRNSVLEDGTSGDVYTLGVVAMTDALRKKPVTDQLRKIIDTDWNVSGEDVETSIIKKLQTGGPESLVIFKKLLDDPVIHEFWRKSLISAVKFAGRAFVMADFLMRNGDLQLNWSDYVKDVLTTNPKILKRALDSLDERRSGNDNFSEQVKATRRQLAKVFFEDRILFEQIIAYKNIGFRKIFREQVAIKMGKPVLAAWTKEVPDLK